MPAVHMPLVGMPPCLRVVNERVFHGLTVAHLASLLMVAAGLVLPRIRATEA